MTTHQVFLLNYFIVLRSAHCCIFLLLVPSATLRTKGSAEGWWLNGSALRYRGLWTIDQCCFLNKSMSYR